MAVYFSVGSTAVPLLLADVVAAFKAHAHDVVPLFTAVATDPLHIGGEDCVLLWGDTQFALVADFLHLVVDILVLVDTHVIVVARGKLAFESVVHIEAGVFKAAIDMLVHHEVIVVVLVHLGLILFSGLLAGLSSVIKVVGLLLLRCSAPFLAPRAHRNYICVIIIFVIEL